MRACSLAARLPAALCRRCRRVRSRATPGRGFGQRADKPDGAPAKSSAEAPEVTEALRRLGVASGGSVGGATRPVDPAEAARGRLDFAQVSSWDERALGKLQQLQKDGVQGKESDVLDELPVTSFAPGSASDDHQGSFYEQVARRLQRLQSRGELRTAVDARVAPTPPFSMWSPKLDQYRTYLADLHAVHAALESAAARGGGALTAWLTLEAPLARGAAIASDLVALREADSPTLSSEELSSALSPHAVAHARLLGILGAVLCDEEAGVTARAKAAQRLCANGYALHVSCVTVGARVGAAQASRLKLGQRGALSLYAHFPALLPSPNAKPGAPEPTPLQALARATDCAGAEMVRSGGAHAFWEELPDAMRRASLLLTPLAVL